MVTPETCTTQYGCKGDETSCIGIGDINDQMAQLHDGNFHQQTATGIEGFLTRKEQNVLPVCLKQAALRARIKLARQEADQFFQK